MPYYLEPEDFENYGESALEKKRKFLIDKIDEVTRTVDVDIPQRIERLERRIDSTADREERDYCEREIKAYNAYVFGGHQKEIEYYRDRLADVQSELKRIRKEEKNT